MQDIMERETQAANQPDNLIDTHLKEMPLEHQMVEAEALANDLKRLVVKCEPMLHEEGLLSEVETLERWMESYRRGLAAAHKICATGLPWLNQLHDRLKLAADEIQRLESEGGNPASKEQTEKLEELMKALRRIEKIKPDIEQAFAASLSPCHH